MSNPVRVGVIGTGFGARNVAPAFTSVEGCQLVDVVSPRDDAAVRVLCGRSDVDLISVHSPPFLHASHVEAAIEAGHAVLCDKPFGLDATESAEMLRQARDAGVVNLLNFERRFDPGREKLHELLVSGVIGSPTHFQYSRFTSVVPPLPHNWLSSKELGGGWIGGQGSHLIDAARWLFGEVEQAFGVSRIGVPERLDENGKPQRSTAEDGFVAALKMASGVTAVIDCALESPVAVPERTVVFGTQGRLEIFDQFVEARTSNGEVVRHDVDLGGRTPLVASMERFAAIACDAVRNGGVVAGTPTFADGLACAEVMDRIGR